MINELVNNIIEAEKKASEIIEGASAKADEILAEASKKNAEKRKLAEQALKTESEELFEKNDAEAKALYSQILKKGEQEAEKITLGASKKEECAEDIARWILSGNC